MKKWYLSLVIVVLVSALVLAACSATPAATTAATTAAPAVATTAPATVAATSAASTSVATIPANKLVQSGQLLVCSDLPYPPQEMYDANGNPIGMDIDIAQGIADKLGLQLKIVPTVFDSIVAALSSGKCDIAVSSIFVTDLRKQQVSMITYFEARQAFVAAKGNPQNIKSPVDLCGKTAAAESGTTEADFLQGQGDFTTNGLPAVCSNAGKPAANIVITQKDSDALQQLQSGKVAAYSTDSPVAVYYQTQNPDQFEVVYQFEDVIPEGIMIPCGASDCTKAPLTEVGQAVQSAFNSMVADGSYASILNKWGLSSGAVQQ